MQKDSDQTIQKGSNKSYVRTQVLVTRDKNIFTQKMSTPFQGHNWKEFQLPQSVISGRPFLTEKIIIGTIDRLREMK